MQYVRRVYEVIYLDVYSMLNSSLKRFITRTIQLDCVEIL